MNELQLLFLGPPQVRRNGEPITMTRAKGLALLLYLALSRAAQPRERVLDLLWPESLAEAARKNMRNTLWAIREALGDDVVEQVGGALRLGERVQVDAQRLEDGLLLLEGGNLADLEAVAALYRGPLADGLVLHEAPDFELWLATERERFVATYIRIVERIAAYHQMMGAWQAVIEQARRILAVDPLREPVHLLLIEAFARLGQRQEAAHQYTILAETLRRELDVAPLPETIARYEALLAGSQPVAIQPAPKPIPRPIEPFIGRENEAGALGDEQHRAGKGEARVVLIAGELGIGKSRLWQAWAATLPAEVHLLATHALETAQPVPFGPLLALFRQPGPARSLLQPPSPLAPVWLAELTRLLPEVAPAWPDLPRPLPLAPVEERPRLLQALTEVLRPLTTPLLVLVIDDLHWADPSTLDWLVYVVDQLHDRPLLVVGTYRPQEASPQLAAIIAGWQRQGRLRHLDLPHLTEQEGLALLRAYDAPGDSGCHLRLVRESGGNPYFLRELGRAPATGVADDLSSLVRARLRATVPAGAYQVLQAAAVLGDLADLATLHATSGRSEEETLDALDEVVALALLTERAGRYSFVHPLVATVLRQELSAARRRFLHRRAAQAIEQHHHPEQVAAALLAHYAAAGDTGQAARYADLAARQAMAVGAFAEAAVYLQQALAWQPTAERKLLLGESFVVLGATDQARAITQAALNEFSAADDVAGITRAYLTLANLAVVSGRLAEAQEWIRLAPLERAQVLDPVLGIQGRLWAVTIDRMNGQFEQGLAQLNEIDRLAKAHGMMFQATQAAFERGNMLANRGDLPAALASFDESLRLAEANANPLQQAMAHNNIGYHSVLTGDLATAQQHVEAGYRLAHHFALGMLWQYLHNTAGELALAQGRLDAADAALNQAFLAAQANKNEAHMANILVDQARVALARNRPTQARLLSERAETTLDGIQEPVIRQKLAAVRDAVEAA